MTQSKQPDTIEAIVKANIRDFYTVKLSFRIKEFFEEVYNPRSAPVDWEPMTQAGIEALYRGIWRLAQESDYTKKETLGLIVKVSQEYLTEFRHYQYRGHACPYFNPTAKPVLVEAIGIIGSDGKLITSLQPGQILFIPFSYTVGGEKSVVTSVAPQLRKIPQSEIPDDYLPLHFSSYLEWCQFGEPMITICCSVAGLWDDSRQKLVCKKCGK